MQSCSTTGLSRLEAVYRWRHRDLPAHSRCSLSLLLPVRFIRLLVVQLIFNSGSAPLPPSARYIHADDGKYRRISYRYALRPARLTPLSSATVTSDRVSDRAILFRKTGRRQTEDFGLNRCRIDIIRFAVVLPER